MTQSFYPYWQWEDYNNGMYDPPENIDTEAAAADQLLTDATAFDAACARVIAEWPVSSDVNLTNMSINRRAWLGQAACSIIAGVPERSVRTAWKAISPECKRTANRIADDWIRKHEINRRELYSKVATYGLFG